jgi:hypothetical protein
VSAVTGSWVGFCDFDKVGPCPRVHPTPVVALLAPLLSHPPLRCQAGGADPVKCKGPARANRWTLVLDGDATVSSPSDAAFRSTAPLLKRPQASVATRRLSHMRAAAAGAVLGHADERPDRAGDAGGAAGVGLGAPAGPPAAPRRRLQGGPGARSHARAHAPTQTNKYTHFVPGVVEGGCKGKGENCSHHRTRT